MGCAVRARAATPMMVAVLLSALAPHAVRAAPVVSPGWVEPALSRDGAKAVVDALWKSDRWRGVEKRIGSGDGAWLALAPRLAPGTDAGASEGLGIALAYALPRNPRAVLAVLGPPDGPVSLTGDRVCGVPFIEDQVKDLPAYRRRAIRAVHDVRAPALAGVRGACLRSLARS